MYESRLDKIPQANSKRTSTYILQKLEELLDFGFLLFLAAFPLGVGEDDIPDTRTHVRVVVWKLIVINSNDSNQ